MRDELERSKADMASLAKRNSVLSETNRSLAVEIDEKRSTLEVSMQEKVCRWLRIQRLYRSVILVTSTAGYLSFHHMAVFFMRSMTWLATHVSLRLARLPRTASSAQCSRRLLSMRAAAPVLHAHAEVAKT